MRWTELAVSPLAAVESREKGARVENVADIPGLRDALLPRASDHTKQ